MSEPQERHREAARAILGFGIATSMLGPGDAGYHPSGDSAVCRAVAYALAAAEARGEAKGLEMAGGARGLVQRERPHDAPGPGGAGMTPGKALELIHQLDPSARVLYSKWTDRFYVSDRIEDGSKHGFLISMTEHRETPDDAVVAYFARLAACKRIVVNAYSDDRREVKWDPIHCRWAAYAEEIDATWMVTR